MHVFAPNGDRMGQIHLPGICSNVRFGGSKRNRPSMTASRSVYAVLVETRCAHITRSRRLRMFCSSHRRPAWASSSEWGGCRLSGLQYKTAVVLFLLPQAVGAEAVLVKGTRRFVGWLAVADGQVRFRDCGGTLRDMTDGRPARTSRRCGERQPFTTSGRAVDVGRGRALPVIGTAAGEQRSFVVAQPASGVLGELAVGRRVRVEGPVPGRASHVAAV